MSRIAYIVLLAVFFALGRLSAPVRGPQRVVETVFRIYTVRIVQPEIMVIRQRGDVVRKLPIAMSADSVSDSAEVVVPIEQKIYASHDYKAYVTGYMSRLDSIEIYKPVNRVRRQSAGRFSVGVQAGYGFTPRGLQPYIGLGVTVRLF